MALVPETRRRDIPWVGSIVYGLGAMMLLGWLTRGDAPTWVLVAAVCLAGSAVAGIALARLRRRRG
ncbi:MAG: hypothetical protein OXF99_05710 [bacterium]|nr:hypothetical protein [bacterium]